MGRAQKAATTARNAVDTDAAGVLRSTCWVMAAIGVLSALVGYPLLLDGAFGIGLGNPNVRAQVLPVGVALGGFGVIAVLAAVGLWHQSVATWRTAILVLASSALLIQLVPIEADPAFRVGVTVLCGAAAAWLVSPPIRRFFVRDSNSTS